MEEAAEPSGKRALYDLVSVWDIRTCWRRNHRNDSSNLLSLWLFSGKPGGIKYSSPKIITFICICSGDDHDYCEHTHQLLLPRGQPLMIREVTVKTISMVMNVRRPGFQLLSLAPSGSRRDNKHTYFDVPCLLPDQLGIYLNTYIPLLALSLFIVFGMNVQNEMRPAHLKNRSEAGQGFLAGDRHADIEGAELRSRFSSPSSPGWFILQGQRSQLKADHPSVFEWVERLKDGSSFFCSARTRTSLRRQGWLWASLLDVWGIAIFPICTFALVTWWVVSH